MSRRRSVHSKTKTRRIVLPQTANETSHEPSLTGGSTKQIQELIDLLRRNNLTELEFERQGIRIRVRHELVVRPLATSAQEVVPTPPQQPMHSVFSHGISVGREYGFCDRHFPHRRHVLSISLTGRRSVR